MRGVVGWRRLIVIINQESEPAIWSSVEQR
jgi:hypothetical protein